MPKTVHVRIAVAVDADCKWTACGLERDGDCDGPQDEYVVLCGLPQDRQDIARHVAFVEADVPVPEPTVVQGKVTA